MYFPPQPLRDLLCKLFPSLFQMHTPRKLLTFLTVPM